MTTRAVAGAMCRLGVIAAALLILVSAPGCACAGEAKAALLLEIRDDRGEPAAEGATVVAHDGDEAVPLEVSDELRASGEHERAGSYRVTVTKPGFADWSEDVRVGKEPFCGHVRTRKVDVTLVPDG